jgi:hypothetical protein
MAMERWCVGARVRWFTGALIQNAGDDSIARFSPSFSDGLYDCLAARQRHALGLIEFASAGCVGP